MDDEKESSDKFFSVISRLRKKWIHSLFKKIFGFEPSYSISLNGDAEERMDDLLNYEDYIKSANSDKYLNEFTISKICISYVWLQSKLCRFLYDSKGISQ